MGRTGSLIVVVAVIVGVAAARVSVNRAQSPHAENASPALTEQRLATHPRRESLLDLPLRFEPNKGQMDERIRFLARGQGFGLFLTRDGATLALHRETTRHSGARGRGATPPDLEAKAVVSMRLVGARKDVEPVGSEVQEGATNYFMGNDPARWRTGLEGYARVRYPGLLPGVDVVYYGAGHRRLEYDLVLAPGTDPKSVALEFEGTSAVTLEPDGSANLHVTGGTIVQPPPLAYQIAENGERELVDVSYRQREGGLGFAVGPHDPRRSLVIDPPVVYATYLGGTGSDSAYGIAVGATGEVVVAGTTHSSDFPTVGPIQTGNGLSDTNVFVSKLNAFGSALVYSTYLGGTSGAEGLAIAIDSAGEAVVTGDTLSPDYPVVSPFQATLAGCTDAFVTKLNAAGSALMYSSYLGGATGCETATGIALDPAGNAYLVGFTNSTDFPKSHFAVQPANAGGEDAFVTKINAAGSSVVYSTYLGGDRDDRGWAVAVDGAGEAFVTGETKSFNVANCVPSSGFPTKTPVQAAGAGPCGRRDGFVTKLNSAGAALVFSTYLGGAGDDWGYAIAVDAAGEAFVTGTTESTNFPVFAAFQPSFRGTRDAFVTKFSAAGTALVYSTYLGGSGADGGVGIAVSPPGNAFVTGYTGSGDFPTVPGVTVGSGTFVAEINLAGTGLFDSGFPGGDVGNAIAIDSFGASYVAGDTTSTTFPTVHPIQASLRGTTNAFVVKVATGVQAPPPVPATSWPIAIAAAILLLGLGVGRMRHRAPIGDEPLIPSR